MGSVKEKRKQKKQIKREMDGWQVSSTMHTNPKLIYMIIRLGGGGMKGIFRQEIKQKHRKKEEKKKFNKE